MITHRSPRGAVGGILLHSFLVSPRPEGGILTNHPHARLVAGRCGPLLQDAPFLPRWEPSRYDGRTISASGHWTGAPSREGNRAVPDGDDRGRTRRCARLRLRESPQAGEQLMRRARQRSSKQISVKGLKAGDPEAWDALVTELGSVIAGYAFRIGAPDPDDVVSATFEAVARSIGSFEGSASQFRSFVFKIAHDRAVDAIRRAQRRPLVASDDAITELPASDDIPVAFEDPDILASIAKLSDDQRRMIELRYVIGLSTRETALALGRSEVATRVALSRAKAKLRDLLGSVERDGS